MCSVRHCSSPARLRASIKNTPKLKLHARSADTNCVSLESRLRTCCRHSDPVLTSRPAKTETRFPPPWWRSAAERGWPGCLNSHPIKAVLHYQPRAGFGHWLPCLHRPSQCAHMRVQSCVHVYRIPMDIRRRLNTQKHAGT